MSKLERCLPQISSSLSLAISAQLANLRGFQKPDHESLRSKLALLSVLLIQSHFVRRRNQLTDQDIEDQDQGQIAKRRCFYVISIHPT